MTEVVERLELEAPTDFSFSYSRPEHPFMMRLAIRAVEKVTGQPKLERMYREWSANPTPNENVFAAAMRLMRVKLEIDPEKLAAVPRHGSLLIIANHPFGVVDGLAIGHIATLVRSDIKIMTHSLLCKPPEVSNYLLPVDFGGTEEARSTTVDTRRRAISWLRNGHCVVVFPSGSVATSQNPFHGKALEPAWHSFIGKLSKIAGVSVLPIYFHGQNSRLFQIASHVNYTSRLSMLFRESMRRMGQPLKISIGSLITPETIGSFSERQSVIDFLRKETLALGGEDAPAPEIEFVWPNHVSFN